MIPPKIPMIKLITDWEETARYWEKLSSKFKISFKKSKYLEVVVSCACSKEVDTLFIKVGRSFINSFISTLIKGIAKERRNIPIIKKQRYKSIIPKSRGNFFSSSQLEKGLTAEAMIMAKSKMNKMSFKK